MHVFWTVEGSRRTRGAPVHTGRICIGNLDLVNIKFVGLQIKLSICAEVTC